MYILAMLNFVSGDATRPQGEGPKVVAHCVNDIGQWGSGFAAALTKRWKRPEAYYRLWYRNGFLNEVLALDDARGPVASFALGSVIFVQVEPGLWVANIIGQHRNISVGERTPIRYDALAEGLLRTGSFCREINGSFHAPKLGSGLARGDWSKIEPLIEQACEGVPATIYTWP